jgi:hypothetical protein
MDGFDHRTLQLAHDRIAAFFRFAHDDGGQLQLGETDAGYRRRVADTWREFVLTEVERLTEDNEFTRAICTLLLSGIRGPESWPSTGSTSFYEIDMASADWYLKPGLQPPSELDPVWNGCSSGCKWGARCYV